MKKLFLSITLVLAMGLSFTSCRDTTKTDDVDDDVEIRIDADDVADDVEVRTDGALERTGRAIDNAANEVKEAGKAIDSAAKEIGDDN